MIIKFTKDVELTVIDEFDEASDNIVSESQEVFTEGEEVDVDILETDTDGFVDLQFGDGSLAMGVNESLFEVISEK